MGSQRIMTLAVEDTMNLNHCEVATFYLHDDDVVANDDNEDDD
jgi:hypothetical protein